MHFLIIDNTGYNSTFHGALNVYREVPPNSGYDSVTADSALHSKGTQMVYELYMIQSDNLNWCFASHLLSAHKLFSGITTPS